MVRVLICRNGCKKSNRSAMRTKFILLPKDACLIENNGNSPDFWSVCLTCTAWILFSLIPMISRKLCGIFYLSIPVFIVHVIEVIVKQSYYPGSLTATAFPVLAFFFWKEHFRTSPTP